MKAENFTPSSIKFFSEKELELILIGDVKSMTLFKYADNLMASRFGYAFSRSGYVQETDQTMFKISLVKGDKTRTKLVRDAIVYILPHLKWRTKDNYGRELNPQEIRFDIFEHNLSAGGRSWDLVYTSDDKWNISGRWDKQDFPSLEAALEYIENNYWYERLDKKGKPTSYDEDEEDED